MVFRQDPAQTFCQVDGLGTGNRSGPVKQVVQGIVQGDQVLASHNVSLSFGPGADYFMQPLAGTIRLAQGQP